MSEADRLRLLFYTESPATGGAEVMLGYLLGALAAEVEAAVMCTVAEVGETIARHRPGVPVFTVRAPSGIGDRRALLEHARVVRAFAPAVLHSNQAWPWAGAYGELAGLLTPGVRVVAVDHLPIESPVPRIRRHGRRLLARRLHAHVAVGERTARMIEQIVGLTRGSVRAVANGVPIADDAIAPAQAPRPVIGALGRLVEQKGFDLLVRALPELPGATLVLVGDGPERVALSALAASLDVADRLLITGWRADARSYLASFDVFALPSRFEGMPLGILEAMHAALPVLATDVGSVAEAVHDGDSGFLVVAGDQRAIGERLGRLLADPSLRTRMGERGRVLARERFTDTAMAGAYEDLYRNMRS